MQRDLLIPTSWSQERLEPFLHALSQQTVSPDAIVFLIHGKKSEEELAQIQSMIMSNIWDTSEVHFHHHLNSDFVPGQWVWYDRNFLIHQATHEMLFMIDDDNIFEKNFFQDCLDEYAELIQTYKDVPVMYSPLIQRRDTSKIQTAGITWFRRWMPAYTYASRWSKQNIKMLGANSLFWPTELFQKIWFDELYRSCLEDIDFSYRVWLSWAKTIVSDTTSIQHMEREKSLLQKKFLWTPEIAYERSKNRILFAKKNATKWQDIQYFGLGLWAQTFWFLLLSIIFWGKQRRSLMSATLKGTYHWLTS